MSPHRDQPQNEKARNAVSPQYEDSANDFGAVVVSEVSNVNPLVYVGAPHSVHKEQSVNYRGGSVCDIEPAILELR